MAQKPKLVNLALQGGGAHGAFTWGVLDRILEEGRLQIAGISGTSAGAMNAVALADGFTRDGPEGAHAALDHFWRAMSDGAKNSPLKRLPIDMLMADDLPEDLAVLSQVPSPATASGPASGGNGADNVVDGSNEGESEQNLKVASSSAYSLGDLAAEPSYHVSFSQHYRQLLLTCL